MKFKRMSSDLIDYKYGPRSVAVGHFKDDVYLDLVIANGAKDNIGIFLGNGDNMFSSSITYSTGLGSVPYMVAVGDFNNDHQIDIAVANFGANSIGIFLGLGNGTFTNHAVISTNSSRPIWINIVDLNNDTILDITVANHGTDSISIFYGHGDGNFSYSMAYTTGYDSTPFAVVTGDLNNDNYLDLIIANHGTDNVGIFLSNGYNTFENQKAFSTGLGSRPYSIVVAHLNNNNMLDIVVANYGTNSIVVFLDYENGAFADLIMYSTGSASPCSIAIGDFNNDHRLDLVITG